MNLRLTFILGAFFMVMKAHGESRITEIIVPVIVKVYFKNAPNTQIDCKVRVEGDALAAWIKHEMDPSKKALFEYAKSDKKPDLLGHTMIYCTASSIENSDRIDEEWREINDKIIITAAGYQKQEIALKKKILIHDDNSVESTPFVVVELIPEQK